LERVIHIADGAAVIARRPLGIGPGNWQYRFYEFQSADYTASKIHSEVVAIGVDAGVVAVAALLLLVVFWLRKRRPDDKGVCFIMILLHSLLDIPFSFLSIVIVGCLLYRATSPQQAEIKYRRCFQVALVIPLALFAVVLSSTMIKNRASWTEVRGEPVEAADMLERRFIRKDTEAVLMQMTWYLQAGESESAARVFTELEKPGAVALYFMAMSDYQRGEYYDAADFALRCASASPHNPMGFELLEDIIPMLDPDSRRGYTDNAALIKEGIRTNVLYKYIEKLEGG